MWGVGKQGGLGGSGASVGWGKCGVGRVEERTWLSLAAKRADNWNGDGGGE